MSLAGCSAGADVDRIPPATLMVDGPMVAAPLGWVEYCNRHAEDPACRR